MIFVDGVPTQLNNDLNEPFVIIGFFPILGTVTFPDLTPANEVYYIWH